MLCSGMGISMAQSQRMVLIEEFTQASCGPCAAANPGFNTLLSANTTKAVSIKYQTVWPGVDPMNEHNPGDVANRVKYYGVQGVPVGMIDGNVKEGNPGIFTQTDIDAEYGVASPFTVTINHWFNAANDSIFINCEVTCTKDITLTKPALRVAMIEKNIKFTTAPGTNGETEFSNVMRKMYPNGNGTTIATSWTIGQKKIVSFSAKIPSYIYNKAEIATLAWVQDDANKNVLQASYSPTVSAPIVNMPVAEFDSDVLSTCDGLVNFRDMSALFPASWSWDFGDGTGSSKQHPSHKYAASGTYTVKLNAKNSAGANLATKTAYITVNLSGAAPTGKDVKFCKSETVNFAATAAGSGSLNWYDENGNLVNTGNTYSPNLSAATTYFVSEMTPNALQTTGAADNTIGSNAGGYYTAGTVHGLFFDVLKPGTLQEVKCYANSAGSRVIEVLDVNGAVVQTKTVNMTAGLNTLALNFSMAAGTGYLLKVGGTLVDLYRNSAGANFPYTTGVINITGNTAGSPAYYYYFYDWKVQQNPCASAALKINGIDTCAIIGVNEVAQDNYVNVYPNPNDGKFTITVSAPFDNNSTLSVLNNLGESVYQEKINNQNAEYTANIDISTLTKGIYVLVISGNKESKTIRKLIVSQ